MRASKFTQDEMVQALRKVSDGAPAAQVCRDIGITETTFYRWRQKYHRSEPGEANELHNLRDENLKLKQIVANLVLENQALGESRRRK